MAQTTYDEYTAREGNVSGGALIPGGALPVDAGTAPVAGEKGFIGPVKPVSIISSDDGRSAVKKADETLARLSPPVVKPTPTSSSTASAGTVDVNSQAYKDKAQTENAQKNTQDFIKLINPETGQEQIFYNPENNKAAIQNLLGSGYQTAESSLSKPFDVSTDTSKASTDLENLKTDLDTAKQNLASSLISDAELESQITAITSQWDNRISEMKKTNEQRQKSYETLGIRLGSRYTGGMQAGSTFGGVLTEEENQGLQRITELEAAKQTAISAAKQAQRDNNWKVYSKQIEIAEKAYNDKVAEVAALNKLAVEENKKIKENEIQATRDSAISGLMSQGITSPMDMLNILNSGGGDFTAKEVADAIKNLETVEKVLPGIVGEWQAAVGADPSLKGMGLEEYLDFKDPTRALDLRQQMLQIQKLEKDLTSNGIDEDASNLLAYAQQYASTGMIPTGLPKGTFGMVSQAAKEMPKPKGTIVSVFTGVADSKAPATEQADYGRLNNIIHSVKRLKELDAKRMGGVVGGSLGAVFGEDDQTNYMTIRKSIVDDMSRMQSGAALTKEEVAQYEEYLPGRFSDTPGVSNILFQDSLTRIEAFEQFINNRLSERLSTNGLAMYGYSKVDVGGKTYTVGDIVSNDKGQVGRVNPDGSITLQ